MPHQPSGFDFQPIVHLTIGGACLAVGTRPVFGEGGEATSAMSLTGAAVFGLAGLVLSYSGTRSWRSAGACACVGHAVQDAAMARCLVWLVESQARVPHSPGSNVSEG